MNMFEDKPTPEQVEFLKRLNRRRAALKEAFTPEVLDILEKEFQTNLPCFQGKAGSYDPLDDHCAETEDAPTYRADGKEYCRSTAY